MCVGTLIDTRTRDILPVDLNALMCRNTRILGTFLAKLRNNTEDELALKYLNISREIERAIRLTMYDEESGSWFDYDHELKVVLHTHRGFTNKKLYFP
jgi:neutral trehalase